MSRVAPDLPELQGVPEAARSLVYMSAFNRAIRSPLTWLAAAIVFGVGAGIGVVEGRALFGWAGAVLGTALGASAAGWCLFKVILPWRTRRVLPSVMDTIDSTTLDHVRQADENITRMVDAHNLER